MDTQPLPTPRSKRFGAWRITVSTRAISTPKIIDSAAVSNVTQAPASMSGRARKAGRHWKL
nr:hypothetical protein GCM10020185_70800 [Pseudomonas brassicacearum subsp. brassicacearum]